MWIMLVITSRARQSRARSAISRSRIARQISGGDNLVIQCSIEMIFFLELDMFSRSTTLDQSIKGLNRAKVSSFELKNGLVKLKFLKKALIRSCLPIYEELGGVIEGKVDVEFKISLL